MSESVQVVCEGETDFIVIEAAMAALLPSRSIVLIMTQPDISETFKTLGENGGGWKGVRNWCQRVLPFFGITAPPKALIIHVDADVADDADVNCAMACPPPAATTTLLRDFIVQNWCAGSVPDQTVFCTPSKNTEAWVLQALYPDDREVRAGIECRPKPETLLAGKSAAEKMVRQKNGKYKKDPKKYKEKLPAIAQQWHAVRSGCSEAERFSLDLVAKLA